MWLRGLRRRVGGCRAAGTRSLVDQRQWPAPTFRRAEYDRVVALAREDFSWDDTKRTAERLVSVVFTGRSLDDGYTFDWASARVREGMMTLSFSKSGTQKLFELPWDGESPEDALGGARRFCRDRVE